MNATVPSAADYGKGNTFLPTSALLIPLSLTAILPNIAPLVWHIRSKNISTSSCLLWILILNLLTFLNALIWHHPFTPLSPPYHGKILCDIEVRLIVAGSAGGLCAATLCLAMGLARVLDVDSARALVGKGGRKEMVRDLVLCWGPPVWMGMIYYVVQNLRYGIAPGYGCTVEYSSSWVSVVLIYMWPIVFSLVTCYYTGLIFYRLHTYRAQISSLLARSNTTKSRFRRLFILACLLTVILLVSSIAQLVSFVQPGLVPYSWFEVHTEWNYARILPEGDTWGATAGRWCWIVFGWMSFLTLGMGEEVMKGYRTALARVGLEKYLCCCGGRREGGGQGSGRRSSWISSLGSKAKLFFNKPSRSSGSFTTLTSGASSRFSKATTLKESPSPLLPITEPKYTPTKPKLSKLHLFKTMPSFGHAFAGIPPPSVSTARTDRKHTRNQASKIMITLPSPTLGGLDDELILQMVGAEKVRKYKPVERIELEDVRLR